MAASLRIRRLAELIEKDETVVDIGADHGLLEKELLLHGHQGDLLAVENKTAPLKRLQNNLTGTGVRTLLSDGLKHVPDVYETAVFAGLGGRLIKSLLHRDLPSHPKIKKLIIDAHRDMELLRRFLVQNGFFIVQETIVFDRGHHYLLSVFKRGQKTCTDLELEFGYKIKTSPAFKDYQAALLRKLDELLEQKLPTAAKEKIMKKKERLMSL